MSVRGTDADGFSLVEVVIAMFLLAVLALAVLPALIGATRASVTNRSVLTATTFANGQLAAIQADFPDDPTAPTSAQSAGKSSRARTPRSADRPSDRNHDRRCPAFFPVPFRRGGRVRRRLRGCARQDTDEGLGECAMIPVTAADDRGTTLVELIIYATVAGLLLAGIASLFVNSWVSQTQTTNRDAATGTAAAIARRSRNRSATRRSSRSRETARPCERPWRWIPTNGSAARGASPPTATSCIGAPRRRSAGQHLRVGHSRE